MGENLPLDHVLELPNEHIDLVEYRIHLDYGPEAESIFKLTRNYIVVHRREHLKGNYAEDAIQYLDHIIGQCDADFHTISDWSDAPRLVYRLESTSQFEDADGSVVRVPKALNLYQKFEFEEPLDTTDDLLKFLENPLGG